MEGGAVVLVDVGGAPVVQRLEVAVVRAEHLGGARFEYNASIAEARVVRGIDDRGGQPP